MAYIPKHESITGSDLTGSSPSTNRTYELQNANAIEAQMQIIIDNTILQNGKDFTLDTDTNFITFLNNVWDEQNISIDYLINDTIASSNTNYATTLQITRFAGIGVEVQLENLGTGDGSERSYDVGNANIIDGSYILYYGSSGSNNLSYLIDETDYAIYLDDGRIYLTEAGLVKVGTDILYLSYTYSPKQSDTVLNSYLGPARAEVDKLTGNYWGPIKSNTQYFDGYDSGYPHTDMPFGTQIDNQPEFELKYKSIQSITSIDYLDYQGNVSGSVDSTYIRFDEDGRVLLGPTTIPNGKRNVRIIYTHGYNETPELVQELCAYIGGMMALVNISGGSYKDVSTYSLGRKSFSIGQVYVNIESSIKIMKKRIGELTESLGYRYAIA